MIWDVPFKASVIQQQQITSFEANPRIQADQMKIDLSLDLTWVTLASAKTFKIILQKATYAGKYGSEAGWLNAMYNSACNKGSTRSSYFKQLLNIYFFKHHIVCYII